MESQSIESTDALSDNTTIPRPPTRCNIAWSAIGLLFASWLCLFLGLAFFWKKHNDVLAENTTQLAQIQEQLSQSQTKYQELQKNLTQIQDIIQKKFSPNDTIAQLSEVKQLIQLAHYNLIYLRDPSSALSALHLADKQLAELNSPPVALDTLRNLLAQNIANLNALPHLDLSSALTQLNALQIQATQLPLLNNESTVKEASPNAKTSEKKWLNAIEASLHSFQQLIVIRHLDKPIQPLLPEAQQQVLQHNLQFLLQQAQWALLHQQQTIYQASLLQAKKAIQQHFAENSSVVQAMIQRLNELEKINLQPSLPDLTSTLQAVNAIRQTLSSHTPAAQKELPL